MIITVLMIIIMIMTIVLSILASINLYKFTFNKNELNIKDKYLIASLIMAIREWGIESDETKSLIDGNKEELKKVLNKIKGGIE